MSIVDLHSNHFTVPRITFFTVQTLALRLLVLVVSFHRLQVTAFHRTTCRRGLSSFTLYRVYSLPQPREKKGAELITELAFLAVLEKQEHFIDRFLNSQSRTLATVQIAVTVSAISILPLSREQEFLCALPIFLRPRRSGKVSADLRQNRSLQHAIRGTRYVGSILSRGSYGGKVSHAARKHSVRAKGFDDRDSLPWLLW